MSSEVKFRPTRGDIWAAKYNADEAIRLLVLRSTVHRMLVDDGLRKEALEQIDRGLANLSQTTFALSRRVAARG